MNLAMIQKLFYEMVWTIPTLCLQVLCLVLAMKGLGTQRKAAVLATCSFSLFIANTVLAPVFFSWRRSMFSETNFKTVYGLSPQLFLYTSVRVALSIGAWLLLALAIRQFFKKTNQCNPAA